MVLELIAIATTPIVCILLAIVITNSLGLTGLLQLFVELYTVTTGLMVLVFFSIIPIYFVPAAIGVLTVIGLYGVYSKNKQREKARNGEYGNEVKWATELIESGDKMFVLAVNSISNTERKEVGIIAESKEELRNLTIERFEEQHGDDQIPQEFMQ